MAYRDGFAAKSRRQRRIVASLARHEQAIAVERRAIAPAVARIAERKVRIERLRKLEARLENTHVQVETR